MNDENNELDWRILHKSFFISENLGERVITSMNYIEKLMNKLLKKIGIKEKLGIRGKADKLLKEGIIDKNTCENIKTIYDIRCAFGHDFDAYKNELKYLYDSRLRIKEKFKDIFKDFPPLEKVLLQTIFELKSALKLS